MKIDDTLHGISTIINLSVSDYLVKGTGFFFKKMGPKDSTKDAQWRKIDDTWLVTNRHILLPKIGGKEFIPDTFTFSLRKLEDDSIKWDPIQLSKEELVKRALVHPNNEVDVGVVRVLDLITEKLKSGQKIMSLASVDEESFPGQNNISAEVGDDLLVIGYPRGYYDKYNIFPIVKSGIIASRWDANFEGKPCFLLDGKLFPGSSGSLVISKPRELIVKNGTLMMAQEKQFAFLGIFSGEPFLEDTPLELDDMTITRKLGFNLGIVWYGKTVVETISAGKKLSEFGQ